MTDIQLVTPIIHCVRHAQAVHNLSVENYGIYDPQLTPLGEGQCQQLANEFPNQDSIELLVTSPLRRTICTTRLGFRSAVDRGIKIIALPELQETGDLPCDTGSDVEVLRKDFGESVDLSLVDENWNTKKGQWASTTDAVQKRARSARQWLKSRPEKQIVVVTHGGLLHCLTQDWTNKDKFPGTGWANTEFRSYEFVEEKDEENAGMKETVESRERRKGSEKPLTETEQIELKNMAGTTQEKEDQNAEGE